MPPVFGNKRILVGSCIAVASTAAVAYAVWSRKSRRRKTCIDDTPEPEPVSDHTSVTTEEPIADLAEASTQSEETDRVEMSIQRGGRRNYRREAVEKQKQQTKKEAEAQTALEDCSRRISWSKEVEKAAEEERLENGSHTEDEEEMQRVMQTPVAHHPLGKHSHHTTESPSLASDITVHSEGSGDSGRGGSGSSGVASSMSPVEEADIEVPNFYEFEVPQNIVGLIIGKKGVVIKDLSDRTGTFILMRQHHAKENYKICSIEGTRDQINACLRMIRRRFPPSRYPGLNLNPVLPPPIASPNSNMWGSMVQLSLPEGVACEVALSSIVDTGHFFLQQPTHPSFTSLTKLDQYMLAVYSQPGGVPELPRPVEMNVICVAPVLGGWFRALTMTSFEETDEVLVKFVDYGGYSRFPSSDLKQIRSDFMALPFQASECYLAHVKSSDGSGWTEEANAVFEQMAMGRVMETRVVSFAPDGLPFVELYSKDSQGQTVQLNSLLVEDGHAVLVEECRA